MPKFSIAVPQKAWSHFTVEADNEGDAMNKVLNRQAKFEEHSYGEDDMNFNNWRVFNCDNN